jgi:FkbM family methyltransferase
VIAYEADGELVGLLADSVRMNWLRNVELVAAAAGAVDGSAEFKQHPKFRGSSIALDVEVGARAVPGGYESTSVPVERLDGRIAEGVPLRIVKIDVEGGELQVLQGMARLLERGSVDFLCIEVDRRNAGRSWHGLMAEFRRIQDHLGGSFSRLDAKGVQHLITIDEIARQEWFSQIVVSFVQ